jgi:hypothetical protein
MKAAPGGSRRDERALGATIEVKKINQKMKPANAQES